jgi:hypothetical protein
MNESKIFLTILATFFRMQQFHALHLPDMAGELTYASAKIAIP